MSNIVATDFRWEKLYQHTENSVFSAFVKVDESERPTIVESDIVVENLEETDYDKNGVRWIYYGSGSICSYECVKLSDGSYLFCVVSGDSFAGTFQSSDDISMEYYKLTAIKENL